LVTTAVFVALAGLALPAARAAGGGAKVKADVDIKKDAGDPSVSNATGCTADARFYPITNPPASTKEIGCKVTIYGETSAQGAGGSVTCQAITATGAQLRCYTEDKTLIQVAQSIHGDSMVTFQAAPTTATQPNECLSIFVENASKYLPKTP